MNNMTQFQTLQALVNRRMPNGTEIPLDKAAADLVLLLPFVIVNNQAAKKQLQAFAPFNGEPFLQEWENETKEIDRLVSKAVKMCAPGLQSLSGAL